MIKARTMYQMVEDLDGVTAASPSSLNQMLD